MSTEKKGQQHPTTEERHATGNRARDEQSDVSIGGSRDLNADWDGTKAELRRQYGQLTDQDLELRPGREEETFDRIAQRLGRRKEEARKLVQATVRRQGNSSASTVGTHTEGTHEGHKDMPEAAERKARRDAQDEGAQRRPKV